MSVQKHYCIISSARDIFENWLENSGMSDPDRTPSSFHPGTRQYDDIRAGEVMPLALSAAIKSLHCAHPAGPHFGSAVVTFVKTVN